MGTIVTQEVYGINAASAADAVTAEISRLERLWSAFIPESEVSLLGARSGGAGVSVSAETAGVLAYAKGVWELSGGAFDVTAAPLIGLWREALARGSTPAEDEIAACRGLVGCGGLEFFPDGRVRLSRAGQRLDLGAIGKGAAADAAVRIYREAGIRSACVNLGGNVAVVGRKPDGSRWNVGIRDPAGGRGDCIRLYEAEDCSVVTSGGYERFAECGGRRYHHIINPLSGRPAESDAAGVTVISASSMEADAFSTAAFVLGMEKGSGLIEAREGARAVLVGARGEVRAVGSMGGLLRGC